MSYSTWTCSAEGDIRARKACEGQGEAVAIADGATLEHLCPVRVRAGGSILEFLVRRPCCRQRRDCQATVFRREGISASRFGDGLRLNVDNLAAFVLALHGGGEAAGEKRVCVGVADAAKLEAIAGDAAIRIAVTGFAARFEMCARRGTRLGADEAQHRHSRRYDECEGLHRGISFQGIN